MLLKSSVDKWQSGYGSEIEQLLKKALLQQQQTNQSIDTKPNFLSNLKKLMDRGSSALGAAKLFFGGM